MLVLEIHKQFKTRALYTTNLELASPTPHSRVTTGTRAAAVGGEAPRTQGPGWLPTQGLPGGFLSKCHGAHKTTPQNRAR